MKQGRKIDQEIISFTRKIQEECKDSTFVFDWDDIVSLIQDTANYFVEWKRKQTTRKSLDYLWHDADVMPEYKDDSLSNNQILVYGNQGGESTSVCSLVAPGIIYSPVMKEEYDWGECPFTKWAYVDDLILSINLK